MARLLARLNQQPAARPGHEAWPSREGRPTLEESPPAADWPAATGGQSGAAGLSEEDDQGLVAAVGGWVPQRPVPTGPERVGSATGRASVRWAPARRAVIGLGIVLLVAVLAALVVVWRAQPSAQAAPAVRRTAAQDAPAGPTAGGALGSPAARAPSTAGPVSAGPLGAGHAAPDAEVVVHVVGAVHRPGLVRLPAGSRVADAVRAAGGATASARPASVNLARLLIDGEQLVVQRRGRPPLLAATGPGITGPVGGATSGTAGPTAPVDLYTATLEALDGLPGIGPVLAQRILDWRTANGRFSAVDELGEVSGIGEATLADLRPVVTV